MDESHFLTRSLTTGDGYTYTLPSLLGAMLADAERLYGPRDTSWTLLGVEFGPDGPHIWYPGNRGHVLIQLHPSALDDRALAIYQLAHECIHLLSPSGGRSANVLEEGLATYHAEDYMRRKVGVDTPRPGIASYVSARDAVQELLAENPSMIREIRSRRLTFRDFTADDVREACPKSPEALIEQVLAPFDRGA